MSAGAFEFTFYEASYGTATHPIRVQPETTEASVGNPAVTNVTTATTASTPISAKVSGTGRSLGLIARRVRLVNNAANPPAGYKVNSATVIPALTEAFYDACVPNEVVTYLGSTWRVTGRTDEIAR